MGPVFIFILLVYVLEDTVYILQCLSGIFYICLLDPHDFYLTKLRYFSHFFIQMNCLAIEFGTDISSCY